jgi:hypothetical protein
VEWDAKRSNLTISGNAILFEIDELTASNLYSGLGGEWGMPLKHQIRNGGAEADRFPDTFNVDVRQVGRHWLVELRGFNCRHLRGRFDDEGGWQPSGSGSRMWLTLMLKLTERSMADLLAALQEALLLTPSSGE